MNAHTRAHTHARTHAHTHSQQSVDLLASFVATQIPNDNSHQMHIHKYSHMFGKCIQLVSTKMTKLHLTTHKHSEQNIHLGPHRLESAEKYIYI